MGRIIDLTQTLRPGMRGVEFEPKFTLEDKGWNAQTLHLYSHCGTHADAPLHFGVNDTTIDEIPLEQCIGPALVADVNDVQASQLITLADLGDTPAKLAPGDSLLIRTGWSSRAGQPEYYQALPRLSEEVALWCAENKLPMLGIEPQAVADPGNLEEITHIHRILLEAGILIVEGLTNTASIQQDRVTFMALPIKIHQGDGAPVRALAIED
jgi:kynurenine formamidase